ncbi:hypothetical protein IWX75_003385 [Arthrobacter sp. CAN_A6]
MLRCCAVGTGQQDQAGRATERTNVVKQDPIKLTTDDSPCTVPGIAEQQAVPKITHHGLLQAPDMTEERFMRRDFPPDHQQDVRHGMHGDQSCRS